jgi:quercetin 2,3-dioxygenase
MLKLPSLRGDADEGGQPCSMAERFGCFMAIASGFDSDRDALPIRARARVLNGKLKVGESIEHALRQPRLAYLVMVDVL